MKKQEQIKEEITRVNLKDICEEIAQKMRCFDEQRMRLKGSAS